MTASFDDSHHSREISRHAVLLGSATVAAKLTGYLRTLALATVIGVGSLANAFGTANAFPNMLFEVLLGAGLRSALVPTLVGEFEKGKDRGWETVSAVANIAVLVLGAFSLLGVVTAPWIFRILTFGLEGEAARGIRAVGSVLLALMIPQILFYGIDLVATGALNAHKKFWIPALSVIAGNAVAIAALFWFRAIYTEPGSLSLTGAHSVVLGGGMTAGVATIAAVELLALKRMDARYRFTLGRRSEGVRKALRAGGWMMVYVLANQIGLVVVLILANRVTGGVAAYQYAYAILLLPYGVIGLALGSALLPEASRRAVHDDREGVASIMSDALGLALGLLVPISLVLAVWGRPIAQLLLGYGAARGAGAEFVGQILSVLAIALVPFTVFQLLARANYAFHRTRTPALVNALGVAVNIVANIGLFTVLAGSQRVVGLAAGMALAYTVAAAVLWGRTNRLLGCRVWPRLRLRSLLPG